MSINKYKNKDEILNSTEPTTADWMKSEDRDLIQDQIEVQKTVELNSNTPFSGSESDVIELHVYDVNGNLVASNHDVDGWVGGTDRPNDIPTDKLDNKVYVDVHKNFSDLGFRRGEYKFVYNFHRNEIGAKEGASSLFVKKIESNKQEIVLGINTVNDNDSNSGIKEIYKKFTNQIDEFFDRRSGAPNLRKKIKEATAGKYLEIKNIVTENAKENKRTFEQQLKIEVDKAILSGRGDFQTTKSKDLELLTDLDDILKYFMIDVHNGEEQNIEPELLSKLEFVLDDITREDGVIDTEELDDFIDDLLEDGSYEFINEDKYKSVIETETLQSTLEELFNVSRDKYTRGVLSKTRNRVSGTLKLPKSVSKVKSKLGRAIKQVPSRRAEMVANNPSVLKRVAAEENKKQEKVSFSVVRGQLKANLKYHKNVDVLRSEIETRIVELDEQLRKLDEKFIASGRSGSENRASGPDGIKSSDDTEEFTLRSKVQVLETALSQLNGLTVEITANDLMAMTTEANARIEDDIQSELELINETELEGIVSQQDPYYDFFSLNFGDNTVLKVINIARLSENEIAIKLYEENKELTVKQKCWLVREFRQSYIDNIILVPKLTKDPQNTLRPANFNIRIDDSLQNETDFSTWDELLGSNANTSQQIIDHYFSGSGLGDVKLNIDYCEFDNFIHFSSAEERVRNFYYKMRLIEGYDTRVESLVSSSYSGSVENNIQTVSAKRNEVISGFDDFEKYLYFQSGSQGLYTYSTCSVQPYPKQYYVSQSSGYTWSEAWMEWQNGNFTFGNGGSQLTITAGARPYIQQNTNSTDAITWYQETLDAAKLYDTLNDYGLAKTTPEHIRIDERNEQYDLFVNMIGHHFDIMWSYINHMTKVHSREEHPQEGISTDLLPRVARQFGWKLSEGNFQDELWDYALGTDENGNFQDTTRRTPSKSKKELTQEVWRRIVNNLPYILKTKGTERSVRALAASYGVPKTLLTIREYGGPSQNGVRPTYNKDQFDYALNLMPNAYLKSQWNSLHYTGSDYRIADSITLRFKTHLDDKDEFNYGTYGTHTLFQVASGSDTQFMVTLEPTGSRQQGNIHFHIKGVTSYFTASVLNQCIFDDDFTSVMVQRATSSVDNSQVNQYKMYVKKSKYGKLVIDEVATIEASGSETSNINGSWTTPENLYIGLNDVYNAYTGSVQELRYWTVPLNNDTFTNHATSVGSYNSNSPTGSFYDLKARFNLVDKFDVQKNTAISSSHPDQTNLFFGNGDRVYASFEGTWASASDAWLPWEEVQYIEGPSIGGNNLYSEKIRIEDNYIERPLNSSQRVEKSAFDRAPIDSKKLGVYFSPQSVINDDIFRHLGFVELDDYIGDPGDVYKTSYASLQDLSIEYWKKYENSNDVAAYLRLFSLFDFSMFKQIEQLLPLRANKILGLVVEPNVLERNKVETKPIETSEPFWDAEVEDPDPVLESTNPTYDTSLGDAAPTMSGEYNRLETELDNGNPDLTGSYADHRTQIQVINPELGQQEDKIDDLVTDYDYHNQETELDILDEEALSMNFGGNIVTESANIQVGHGINPIVYCHETLEFQTETIEPEVADIVNPQTYSNATDAYSNVNNSINWSNTTNVSGSPDVRVSSISRLTSGDGLQYLHIKGFGKDILDSDIPSDAKIFGIQINPTLGKTGGTSFPITPQQGKIWVVPNVYNFDTNATGSNGTDWFYVPYYIGLTTPSVGSYTTWTNLSYNDIISDDFGVVISTPPAPENVTYNVDAVELRIYWARQKTELNMIESTTPYWECQPTESVIIKGRPSQLGETSREYWEYYETDWMSPGTASQYSASTAPWIIQPGGVIFPSNTAAALTVSTATGTTKNTGLGSTGSPLNPWTNPSNATNNYAFDYASSPTPTIIQESGVGLWTFGYNFTDTWGGLITANDVVYGTEVGVRRLAVTSSVGEYIKDHALYVQNTNQGNYGVVTWDTSLMGTNQADTGTNWEPVQTWANYGSPTDNWGHTLGYSFVDSNYFGVMLSAEQAGNSQADVDAVTMSLHHSTLQTTEHWASLVQEPSLIGSPPQVQPNLGWSNIELASGWSWDSRFNGTTYTGPGHRQNKGASVINGSGTEKQANVIICSWEPVGNYKTDETEVGGNTYGNTSTGLGSSDTYPMQIPGDASIDEIRVEIDWYSTNWPSPPAGLCIAIWKEKDSGLGIVGTVKSFTPNGSFVLFSDTNRTTLTWSLSDFAGYDMDPELWNSGHYELTLQFQVAPGIGFAFGATYLNGVKLAVDYKLGTGTHQNDYYNTNNVYNYLSWVGNISENKIDLNPATSEPQVAWQDLEYGWTSDNYPSNLVITPSSPFIPSGPSVTAVGTRNLHFKEMNLNIPSNAIITSFKLKVLWTSGWYGGPGNSNYMGLYGGKLSLPLPYEQWPAGTYTPTQQPGQDITPSATTGIHISGIAGSGVIKDTAVFEYPTGSLTPGILNDPLFGFNLNAAVTNGGSPLGSDSLYCQIYGIYPEVTYTVNNSKTQRSGDGRNQTRISVDQLDPGGTTKSWNNLEHAMGYGGNDAVTKYWHNYSANSDTTYSGTTNTKYLRFRDFGFQGQTFVPGFTPDSEAVITGITVRLKTDFVGRNDDLSWVKNIYLHKAGEGLSVTSDNKGSGGSGGTQTSLGRHITGEPGGRWLSFGGPTDTWGLDLVLNDVTDDDFGFIVQMGNVGSGTSGTALNPRIYGAEIIVSYNVKTTKQPTRSHYRELTTSDNYGGPDVWLGTDSANNGNGGGPMTPGDASVARQTGPGYDGIVTNYLKGTNWNFNIPGGNTILGISAEVQRTKTSGIVTDNEIRLYHNSSAGLTPNNANGNKASVDVWPTTIFDPNVTKTYGGSSDLWDKAWTPSDINSSNFGLWMTANVDGDSTAAANVRRMEMTVYHIAPDPSETSYKIVFSDFGFNVPNDYIVKGIRARVRKKGFVQGVTQGVEDIEVTIGNDLYNGTGSNYAKSGFWNTDSSGWTVYGGNSSLWGQTWSDDNLNLETFNLQMDAALSSSNAQIDDVQMKVYYAFYVSGSGDPAEVQSGIPQGVLNHRYIGTKMTSADINEPSSDTLDGGPVVESTEVNPNALILQRRNADQGTLTVGTTQIENIRRNRG